MNDEVPGPAAPSGPPLRLREVAERLAHAALAMVRDPAGGGVRVEDYLTLLSAAAGEAVLVATGLIDPEQPAEGSAPGRAVFGDPVNMLLTGDMAVFRSAAPGSVAATLMALLVPAVFDAEHFAVVDNVYMVLPDSLGRIEWGAVATTVPDENKPRIPLLQAAFHLRDYVDSAQRLLGVPTGRRHVPCIHALAVALRETRHAIAPEVAIALSMEVLFAAARTVPVPRATYQQAFAEARAHAERNGHAVDPHAHR